MPMSKLAVVALTASVCMPLGALLREDAVAEPRRLHDFFGTVPIEGHQHFANAQALMQQAVAEIDASKRSSEPLWSDTTGRATAVADLIEKASAETGRTANWVRDGMADQASNTPWPSVFFRFGFSPPSPIFLKP